ncbi:Ran-specific GTPase-activating protein 1 [Tolypocladium capitatum]|uniref:Ran-specific GTPase-activating protein 1 n=1 Tax=Tolypocladium capitatum TaxID=45235 RepID=A0A2K3Q040_9HYPO|nr:Ran-specific GTPase-activating protein 1 [Tolypocladium capitatum]
MPEGSFRIALDAPKRVHRPADEISGRVVCSGNDGQVQIDFRGIAEVKLPGSLTGQRSRTVATLFHSQVVASGSRSDIDGPSLHLWPFNFSFPLTAQPSEQWQVHPLFASLSRSPLPPSFTYSSPLFDCKVEYSLEAKVVDNHYDSVADRCFHKCYLLFEPATSGGGSEPPLASFTRNFTTSSRPLGPKPDGQSQSFRGRLSSYISRHGTASTRFTVDVKVPSAIIQRERFPCHVSVRVDDSIEAPTPRLEVRGLTVVILSHTYNLDIPFRVNEDVDLSTILSDLHAPLLPPSFTTYNISRRYEMKIDLLVACVEDQFQFLVDVPSLKVLPAGATVPFGSTDDQPPSYNVTMASQSGSTVVPPYESQASSAGAGHEFETKARLFEFVREKAGWKERCRGSLYLQREESSSKTRLLVRQDGTHKIFADHYITAEMQLMPIVNSDRSWTWHSAADLSGETVEALHFAARFKDSESANVFKAAFFKAQDHPGAAHVKPMT